MRNAHSTVTLGDENQPVRLATHVSGCEPMSINLVTSDLTYIDENPCANGAPVESRFIYFSVPVLVSSTILRETAYHYIVRTY